MVVTLHRRSVILVCRVPPTPWAANQEIVIHVTGLVPVDRAGSQLWYVSIFRSFLRIAYCVCPLCSKYTCQSLTPTLDRLYNDREQEQCRK